MSDQSSLPVPQLPFTEEQAAEWSRGLPKAPDPYAQFGDVIPRLTAYHPPDSDLGRLAINAENTFRNNWVTDVSKWAAAHLVAPALHLDPQKIEEAQRQDDAAFTSRYQNFPNASGLWEHAIALTGSLAPAVMDPLNLVGAGVGSQLAGRASPVVGGLWAKVFGGVAGASVANTVGDAVSQTAKIANARQDGFDFGELAINAGLGALAGGTIEGVIHGVAPRVRQMIKSWSDDPDSGPIGDKMVSPWQEATSPEALQAAAAGEDVPAVQSGIAAAEKAPETPSAAEPGNDVAAPKPEEAPPPSPAEAAAQETVKPAAEAATDIQERAKADPQSVPPATEAASTPATPGKPAGVFMFDPTELKVDPETFQFKSEGDAEGVTSKLRFVKEWDPAAANQVIVWQAKDGENFVADGHQRSGLARRLTEEGAQGIKLPGLLFRESDGLSAQDVMMLAARKNIGEGSASPLDAAKIFRASPKMGAELQGISDYRIRQAQDLARLGEDPWRMALNDVVTPEQAAIVGRHIPEDEARQAAAIQAISRFEPSNVDETTALVRRVVNADMAASEKGAQGSLFGEPGPESTIGEEMRIVAAALKVARSDKALFARVVNAADTIEDRLGGSVDRSGAGQIRDEANLVALYISRKADTAGPIRDALLAAAREVKGGKRSVSEAARSLVENVRATLAGDDGARGRPGGSEGGGGERGGGDDQPSLLGRVTGGAGDDEQLGRSVRKGRGAPARAEGGTASAGPINLDQLQRLHELTQQLQEQLGNPPVRQGRLSVRGGKGSIALGQYDPQQGVVRVRMIDDMDTLAHELGHDLEVKLGQPLQALFKQHDGELRPAAYAGANKAHIVKEGFAEYIRWALTNPTYAAKALQNFDRDFRALLAKDRPDLLKTFADIPKAYADWIAQPSRAAVASTVVSPEKPGVVTAMKEALGKGFKGFVGTIADRMNQAYGAFMDDAYGLDRAVREIAKIHKERTGANLDLAAADNPSVLLRMGRGAGASGMTDLRFGVRGYRSLDVEAPALRDVIIEATGAKNSLGHFDDDMVDLFGSYLASRRLVGEWDRFNRGELPNPPDKLTAGDHVTAVAEWDKQLPQFSSAAEKYYQINQALWKKTFDAGLITREQFEGGQKIRDYAPLQRRFDDDKVESGSKAAIGKGPVVRRFRGSSRDIINPLYSTMAYAHQLAGRIAMNDAVRSLMDVARLAGNGAGAIAERIPATEMRGTLVDPIEAAFNAAKASGLSDREAFELREHMFDMIGDTKTTQFRPATINEKGEPIVFYRDGGELQAARLADGQLGKDMLNAFNSMTRPEAHALIKFLGTAATVSRAGITSAPEFIFANLIRDQEQSWILYGKPFQRVRSTIAGAADDIIGTQAARDYNAVGGLMGGTIASGWNDSLVTRDLNTLARRGWRPWRPRSFGEFLEAGKGLLEATEISETAGRLGNFKIFRDEASKRGLAPWEATFEAAWRARDYLDFNRRGSLMGGLARVIPFLNAALQGLDKVTRHMIAPMFRDVTLEGDAQARSLAARSWAYLGMATIGGTVLYALQQQQWQHEEIPPYVRATHWTFLWGDKFVAIPKPFELGAVMDAGEAIWDSWGRNEPGQVGRWLDDAMIAAAPPSLLQGNPLIKTMIEQATGVDLFTGNPIVPDRLKGLAPFMQWTQKTSEASRWMGEVLGVSPVATDHLITNFFGSWGSDALALSDWATGQKGQLGWDDFAVTRRFIKDESRGSRSVSQFYDEVGRANGAMEIASHTWHNLAAGNPRDAADFLARQDAATRAYVTAAAMSTDVRRAQPLLRARAALTQINALRREVANGAVATADGQKSLTDQERGVADDILGDLAMTEARNALVLTHARGWDGKPIEDVAGYARELAVASPATARALADRYATAKVRKFAAVAAAWPGLEQDLLAHGTAAPVTGQVGRVKDAGTELDGKKLPKAGKVQIEGEDD